MKTWNIKDKSSNDIISTLLKNRGITTKKDQEDFLHPKNPNEIKIDEVDIDEKSLHTALVRIQKAIEDKESTVVYTDYDADGITSGAILWEILHALGARVMPYVPHRVEEGYGLSKKGIDAIHKEYKPSLVITVDHGITAVSQVAYAKSLGIDVIVTDHHVKPKELPDCLIVHTTKLCAAGIAWFIAHELTCLPAGTATNNPSTRRLAQGYSPQFTTELLSLAAIGTIADMVPLVGPNRSIVKYGLEQLNKTKRVGLLELMKESGIIQGIITSYDVSHILAPRLNAVGRLVHALDALRLLCTTNQERAKELAEKLGGTNKERQQMTIDTTIHAKINVQAVYGESITQKIIFAGDESYNQGIIGLVAGKLVETYYLPSIVFSIGETLSKASARSIAGFNIIEAIRTQSDLLIDVGGHPMAAGFTIETKHIELLKTRLEEYADKLLNDEILSRKLNIDAEIPLSLINESLWEQLLQFAPYGMSNPEPIFVTQNVKVVEARLIGRENKHLKLQVTSYNPQPVFDAVAFNLADFYSLLIPDKPIDIAYTIDMNQWNGNRKLQLKIKDIHVF